MNTTAGKNGGPNKIHFKGQRFVVLEWMLEGLMRTLGAHVEKFDLHDWFFELDARATKFGQVIPRDTSFQWLEAQTVAEAKRRGLPIATVPAAGGRSEPQRTIPGADETRAYLDTLRGIQ